MIEVRIPRKKIEQLDHAVHVGIYVLQQLRDASIPIVGTLWPMAVESGRLECPVDDPFDDTLVWRWQP